MKEEWLTVESGQGLYDVYNLGDDGNERAGFSTCMSDSGYADDGITLYSTNPDRVVVYCIWGRNREDERVLLSRCLVFRFTDSEDKTTGWGSPSYYRVYDKELFALRDALTYHSSPRGYLRLHYAGAGGFPYDDWDNRWYVEKGSEYITTKKPEYNYIRFRMRYHSGNSYVFYQRAYGDFPHLDYDYDDYDDDDMTMDVGQVLTSVEAEFSTNPILKDWNYQPTALHPFPDVKLTEGELAHLVPYLWTPFKNTCQPTLTSIMEAL